MNKTPKIPKMSRSHFKYLAGLMADIRPDATLDVLEYQQWEHTVNSMAIALTWTNDNFDRFAFKAACGVD